MKGLTKSEEEVMQALWTIGHGFLKDVLEAMAPPKPHSNTVATVLKILIEKGFVSSTAQGRNNVYRPLVSKMNYGKKSLKQLVKGYFEGSASQLVAHFIKDEKLSNEELESILKQIRELKK